MDPSRSPDPLSRTLAAWRVSAPRNPQFRTAVWERIASRAQPLPWANYLRQHGAAVSGALVLAIAVGALSGRGWARAQAQADSARLAAIYVGGLDARTLPAR